MDNVVEVHPVHDAGFEQLPSAHDPARRGEAGEGCIHARDRQRPGTVQPVSLLHASAAAVAGK
jgi:hypothetical protein